MNRNQHKSKRKRGGEAPISGGGNLSATLNQIVDYAKGLEDRGEAERMELMCYRLFGRRLTPEAADKIAEIPQKFKKKRTPSIGKVININNGDNVREKTMIPHVDNFMPQIQSQTNNLPPLGLHNNKQLKKE